MEWRLWRFCFLCPLPARWNYTTTCTFSPVTILIPFSENTTKNSALQIKNLVGFGWIWWNFASQCSSPSVNLNYYTGNSTKTHFINAFIHIHHFSKHHNLPSWFGYFILLFRQIQKRQSFFWICYKADLPEQGIPFLRICIHQEYGNNKTIISSIVV